MPSLGSPRSVSRPQASYVGESDLSRLRFGSETMGRPRTGPKLKISRPPASLPPHLANTSSVWSPITVYSISPRQPALRERRRGPSEDRNESRDTWRLPDTDQRPRPPQWCCPSPFQRCHHTTSRPARPRPPAMPRATTARRTAATPALGPSLGL